MSDPLDTALEHMRAAMRGLGETWQIVTDIEGLDDLAHWITTAQNEVGDIEDAIRRACIARKEATHAPD